jgi:hypothetical protein
MVGVGGKCTKPVLLGYICRGLLAGDDEVDDAELAMVEFAASNGFLLGHTYIEEAAGVPLAFGALVEALGASGGDAVVLPGMLHLATLGPRHDMKMLFERATGVRVLVI